MLASFIAGNFCFHLATTILVPMLPLIRETFGLTYFESGLLVSATTITYALTQLPVAASADRLRKRLLSSIGLLGVAVATFSAGLSGAYLHLWASMALLGVFGGLYRAPASTLLSQSFATAGRGRALGMHQIGGSIGHLVAPVVAGTIATTAGWRWSFILLAAPAALAGSLVWMLARRAEEAIVRGDPASWRPGFRWRQVVRPLAPFVLLSMAEQVTGSAMNAYLPLFLVDKHAVAPVAAGMFVGLVYGTGVLGAPLGGSLSDRFGRKPLMLAGIIVAGPALFLVAQAPFGAGLIVALLVYGLAISFRMPVMESLIADLVPWEQRVRVMSLYYLAGQAVAAVGTPLVGRITDAAGPTAAFTGLAVAASAVSLLVVAIWRRL